MKPEEDPENPSEITRRLRELRLNQPPKTYETVMERTRRNLRKAGRSQAAINPGDFSTTHYYPIGTKLTETTFLTHEEVIKLPRGSWVYKHFIGWSHKDKTLIVTDVTKVQIDKFNLNAAHGPLVKFINWATMFHLDYITLG